MGQIKITQQEIYATASLIIAEGLTPTHSLLKTKLGKGSFTTIHKYFKQWKEECFKKSILSLGQNTATKISQLENPTKDEFLEKKRNLEQTLNKQITQNEHYAKELINAEKTNIALKQEIYQLQATMQELQLTLTESKAINNTLKQVNQKIQNRLDINDNGTIKKMQQTIDDLRAELKMLNETSLAALREASTKGHEALMQEKVTSINLQAKIDSLNKELMESKKQLNIALMKVQAQNQPFLRQIEWQQKIIQNHVGFEKLRQLEEEELRSKFNAKVEGSYGK